MIQFMPQNHEMLYERAIKLCPEVAHLKSISGEPLQYFSVDDGRNLLGFSIFEFISPQVAVFHTLFVTPQERGNQFGDGLFRATLNGIEIRGGAHVIFLNADALNRFYDREGIPTGSGEDLTRSGVPTTMLHTLENQQFHYLQDIAAFFSKPCKGHAKK